MLKRITFTDEVLAWVSRALRESHHDEKKFHEDAIVRLQREHKRIEDRIDMMYMDKLAGEVMPISSIGRRRSSVWSNAV